MSGVDDGAKTIEDSLTMAKKAVIEANLTPYIASDAHNVTSRSLKMEEAFNFIESNFGKDYVYLF